MFEFPYHHQQVCALLTDKQKVWRARWKKTDADITAMAEEFNDMPDVRVWETEKSSDPEIKAKVEMAFMWMTAKDELELRYVPARVHA